MIYRPQPTRENGLSTSNFLDHEWPTFLARYTTIHKNIIITGDLNFHLDKQTDRDTVKFMSVLESCGMRQHISEPTHIGGHTLDVIITRDTDNRFSNMTVTDPGLTDHSGKAVCEHYALTFILQAARPAPVSTTV